MQTLCHRLSAIKGSLRPVIFECKNKSTHMPHFVFGINFLVLCVNLIPVHLSLLACSCSSLCQLTTVTIHNFLSPSLCHCAQDLATSFTYLSHHRLPSGIHRVYDWTAFLPNISVFVFSFFITLFLFGSVRQIKLAVRK